MHGLTQWIFMTQTAGRDSEQNLVITIYSNSNLCVADDAHYTQCTNICPKGEDGGEFIVIESMH